MLISDRKKMKILMTGCAVLLWLIIMPVPAGAAESCRFEWTWFFHESESSEEMNLFTVRPFYLKRAEPERTFTASLMPLLFWRYETRHRDDWKGLLGLWGYTSYRHPGGVIDNDFGLFPFLFYGTSPDESDRYFLLWPFGGTLKGKFGYEKITAALFPGFLLFIFFPPAQIFSWTTLAWLTLSMVPVYSSWSMKDYRAWGILWPLSMRGSGNGRDDIRIMPFYSRKHKEGMYDRYSVLMILNWSHEYYSGDRRHMFFLFPLSGRISAFTILWPFFSWGYDKKRESRQYNLPWPLVQIEDTKDPQIYKRIFFPFYGIYRYGKSETFFVTPLYFRLRKKAVSYDSEYHTSCLIVWWHKKHYHAVDRENGMWWRYFKIWPLLSVECNELGAFSFNLLSLLPFRDPEGYERLYEPLWSIVEYRRLSCGEKRLGILFRTYFQRWGEGFFQCKIPLVVTYRRIENRVAELSLLFSMFGFSHSSEGRYIRLFWIPLRIGEPEEDVLSLMQKQDREAARESWEVEALEAMNIALCQREADLCSRPGGFYASCRI
jgi:hypothetical protein